MDRLLTLCWLLLAAVHLPPAAVLLFPALTERMYGVAADGQIGLLLVHRAALFAAVVAVCVYAALEPAARRAATILVGLSVLSFLVLYARASAPPGPLRTIALADAAALLPLAYVIFRAWSAR
jgi:hypothetical protein